MDIDITCSPKTGYFNRLMQINITRPSNTPVSQGAEFLGPGWYCKDRVDVKKNDVFAVALKQL